MDPRGDSGKMRPLALIGGLLVFAALTHATLVGCGKKTEPASEPPEPPDTSDTAGIVGMDPVALGDKVYRERCVLCHGPEGKGDGPAAAGLNPKPRNHTDGAYMKTRTDEDLLGVIRNGKGGMPAWGAVLSEAEIQAVLGHVRSLAK